MRLTRRLTLMQAEVVNNAMGKPCTQRSNMMLSGKTDVTGMQPEQGADGCKNTNLNFNSNVNMCAFVLERIMEIFDCTSVKDNVVIPKGKKI